ncbi:MAG: rhodanese-like domain-containing protein, partial [Bacteroidia bacterium]
ITINTSEELNRLFNAEEGIMVDVRNQEEYDEGHLEGALNIDLMTQRFIEYFSELEKNTQLFIYCSTGSRSKVAVKVLKEMGFQNLYNLENGIREWDGVLLS